MARKPLDVYILTAVDTDLFHEDSSPDDILNAGQPLRTLEEAKAVVAAEVASDWSENFVTEGPEAEPVPEIKWTENRLMGGDPISWSTDVEFSSCSYLIRKYTI